MLFLRPSRVTLKYLRLMFLDKLVYSGVSTNPSASIAFRVATSSITFGSGLDAMLFVRFVFASIPEQIFLCHETIFFLRFVLYLYVFQVP